MTTQSIVAYRNPAEQWFWESGAVLYVSGALVLLLFFWLCVLFFNQPRRRK